MEWVWLTVDKTKPAIFISIASYCDPILPFTLDQCLEMANSPENLKFGICWQFDERDDIDLTRFKNDPRFQFAEYPYLESEGGSWARNIAQEFWDGEDYSLQIDSHMAFAKGWDQSLVRMMREAPADKPLITMIAPLFILRDRRRIYKQGNQKVRSTKLADWQKSTNWAPWFDWGVERTLSHCRNRFISGQFVFTLGKWTEEVRQDPEHYYWGEEFALSLRSYTHGYDIFVPDEVVAWHMLHPNAPPRRHWENGPEVVARKNRVAFERLSALAFSNEPQDEKKLGRYGLGSVRSRAEYEQFSGMDFQRKLAHPDTFSGKWPDPVTIKSNSDWNRCISMENYIGSSQNV